MTVCPVGAAVTTSGEILAGTSGVVTTTLISRAVAAILILIQIRNPSNIIHLRNFWKVKFEKHMVGSILSVGIPNGFENGMFNFGKIIVQALVATLGTAAIAANAVLNSVSGLAIVPGTGMGLAMVTVIGQCVGDAPDPLEHAGHEGDPVE